MQAGFVLWLVKSFVLRPVKSFLFASESRIHFVRFNIPPRLLGAVQGVDC